MSRLARVVIPGLPHHVTQRGNRRQQTFFRDADYQLYKRLMAESCALYGVSVLAYCLMPNHVHLILVPDTPEGLGAAVSRAHRAYTVAINKREEWSGYLWQGRFWSRPMDAPYLLMAARYIERNPVDAGIVRDPRDHPWSSAVPHIAGIDDDLVIVAPLLDLVPDWSGFLSVPVSESDRKSLERGHQTGRPLGSDRFIESLEAQTRRKFIKQKPGPKLR